MPQPVTALLPVRIDNDAAANNGLRADMTVVQYSDLSFIVLREDLVPADVERRPTITAHIRAVKEAYKQGLLDAEAPEMVGCSHEDLWAISESRGLLAQCWLDAVDAMDRADAS